ncbi:MAG: hypothetical protein M3440_06455 [Chloroflexota bacterium]|nr:hypothetical protein [Chloroflexota bacterium]
MTAYHVIALPTSSARAPMFITEIHRTDYRSGHVDIEQSNPYMPFDTREAAEASMFPARAWPGGYDIAYVGDGFVICSECALKAYRDDGEPDHEGLHNGEIIASVWHADTEDSGGVTCDHCNEYIVEPFCVECGDEEGDDLMFRHDNYNMFIHPKCLAERVIRGDVVKTSKRTYEHAPFDTWTR